MLARISLIIPLIIVISLLIVVLQSCRPTEMLGNTNRSTLMRSLKKARVKFERSNQENTDVRVKYAELLFKAGQFEEAEKLIIPLAENTQKHEILWLAANLHYLKGEYTKAERYLIKMKELPKLSISKRAEADLGLTFIYYQTLQYNKSHKLFKGIESAIKLPVWEMMKAYENETPYNIQWHENTISRVPFLLTDPLPVIPVIINGKQINVFIDTGAELFYLDKTIAEELGITPLTEEMDNYFAGGKKSKTAYAKAESLTIGTITIESLPVITGAVSHLSSLFKDSGISISGILGTGELRHFLTILDYVDKELVLKPSGAEDYSMNNNDKHSTTTVHIPFRMGLTHIMVTSASINKSDDITLFVDSGLAESEASLLLPKETLQHLKLPLPEKMETINDDSGGGLGGGGFKTGKVDIETLKVGPLTQKETKALYGAFPKQLYNECGFIVDGIISHNFLRNYRWSIDFEKREMLFEK